VDIVALKEVGCGVAASISAFGVKYRTRADLRAIVSVKIRELGGIDDAARRVVGDHVMSLFGYGGGM
jgi:hypothetical protein